MSLLEVFCDVDDFMRSFAPQGRASQLVVGKQRERGPVMSQLGDDHSHSFSPATLSNV